jgi:ATP-dependent Lon protease
MRFIVRGYTREAGVRELERKIAKICRQTVKRQMSGQKISREGSKEYVIDTLGVAKYYDDIMQAEPAIGLVNGLAWTSVGGEILKVETLLYPGKSQLILTGSLGNVMKESIRAAWSLVKSKALADGMSLSFFQEHDIHVHVPEGATPKDGPSAGIAVALAMFSAVKGQALPTDIAMTGEVTLRGNVLRIGGLKEKLIAAHRYSMRKVIIPQENVPDLAEIPSNVKDALEIVAVSHFDEVLMHAMGAQH